MREPWWLLAISLVACEHKVEEPRGNKPQTQAARTAASPVNTATRTATSHGKAAGTTLGDSEAPVCPRPLPPRPERSVPRGPDPRCPPDPLVGREPVLRMGAARFAQANVEVGIEIAEDSLVIQRGLMFRTSLGENRGMLFLFDHDKVQTFWMENTCIPLDMIYIAADGLIVGIEENVPTLTRDSRSCGCPSRYVLEMNAGWSRAHGVAPGQYVEFSGL